ncbi:hypothetical protein IscW_ISCW001858 [Ixodes scapularis]|uniref:RRM domain-containing protein n=1 Tax=Ixodes scapularis TaxID=6945 RepID=B7PAF8_IXOSC|nr:hypothetical protein IscW_ISCW001858 [Ixodes scapularis]|eukprot:XP_002406833.1 hypothetical protein IscW_ISCW001858 [Ixodes scapularis]
MNNSDLEDFYHQTAEDSLPVATGGRRLPCWCRGRERAPLESLPLFQFLKDQYEADGVSSDIPSEGSHRNQVAQTTEQAVHSNPERSTTKEPQFWAKKTGSLPSKATNKKPSFNPAEFVGADSLECGASWANARESHSASSEDDSTDLSDEEGVTAAGKRHIGLEMCADVVERATSAVSTSSLSESSPEEVAPEGHPPPWTFKMANFPDSVTAEQISEILAPFSEVTSVVLTPGPAGVTARVT